MTRPVADSPFDGRWRIGVDVGGTFTDMILASADGRIVVAKVPSVPGDPAQGVLRALAKAADLLGVRVAALLGQCSLFVHGSTVAKTATMVAGKVPWTGQHWRDQGSPGLLTRIRAD